MTSNVYNQGIAHAGFKPGTRPLCGNRRAHYVLAIDGFRADTCQCRRCASKLADMDRKLAAKALAAETKDPDT